MRKRKILAGVKLVEGEEEKDVDEAIKKWNKPIKKQMEKEEKEKNEEEDGEKDREEEASRGQKKQKVGKQDIKPDKEGDVAS